MHTRFTYRNRIFVAALGWAAASCQWLSAAEPIATAQAPQSQPPASSRRMLVTQIVPAVQLESAPQNSAPASTIVPVQATAAPFPAMTPIQSPAVPAPSPPVRIPQTSNQFAPAGQVPPAVVVPVPIVPPQEPLPEVVEPLEEVTPPPPAPAYVPIQMAPGSANNPSPFLDDTSDDLTVLEEQNGEFVERRGVRPYGGGHPSDWPWGCNGSPYRTGPGMCDDWKVGCRWHVTVDGMLMSHQDANLPAIEDGMLSSFPLDPASAGINTAVPDFEQFDSEGGARITFTSQVAKQVGWDMRFVYEGIPEWNASIAYPPETVNLDYAVDPIVLVPPIIPPPFPQGIRQRKLHYRSALHSGELNAVKDCNNTWRPLFGVRYFRYDDEINDFLENEAQPPLAGPNAGQPLGIGPAVTTDRLNLFDIQNNLIGAQIGLLHDTWRVNQRFAFEGVINAGVYYNRIKYTNLVGIYTTQVYADNTATVGNETRVDFSDAVVNDVREYSEIAYHGEASLSGVMRLNRCWALRGGYQVLYIANVHLAEDAYLGNENVADDLLFHGWHAGIECRR